jgi:hypothetical protein
MASVEGRHRRCTASTTYYAMSADQLLSDAQRVLDTHVTSSATGRCRECGSLGPCWRRENAVVVFSRTLRLPTRQPGASQPELINARRTLSTADHWPRRRSVRGDPPPMERPSQRSTA